MNSGEAHDGGAAFVVHRREAVPCLWQPHAANSSDYGITSPACGRGRTAGRAGALPLPLAGEVAQSAGEGVLPLPLAGEVARSAGEGSYLARLRERSRTARVRALSHATGGGCFAVFGRASSMHAHDGAESVQIVCDGLAISGSSSVPALTRQTSSTRSSAGGRRRMRSWAAVSPQRAKTPCTPWLRVRPGGSHFSWMTPARASCIAGQPARGGTSWSTAGGPAG